MKKYLLFILILCFVCLMSCNEEATSETTDSSNNTDIKIFNMSDVNNLKCEINLGQTDESIVFGKEKALEIYNIISSYKKTENDSYLDGYLSKSSVNPNDTIYINFTGDPLEYFDLPIEHYGCYFIDTDDIVMYSASPFISHQTIYQFEKGLYEELKLYISEQFDN